MRLNSQQTEHIKKVLHQRIKNVPTDLEIESEIDESKEYFRVKVLTGTMSAYLWLDKDLKPTLIDGKLLQIDEVYIFTN